MKNLYALAISLIFFVNAFGQTHKSIVDVLVEVHSIESDKQKEFFTNLGFQFTKIDDEGLTTFSKEKSEKSDKYLADDLTEYPIFSYFTHNDEQFSNAIAYARKNGWKESKINMEANDGKEYLQRGKYLLICSKFSEDSKTSYYQLSVVEKL